MLFRTSTLLPFFILLCITDVAGQVTERSPIEIDKPSKIIYFKANPLSILQGPVPIYSGEARLTFEAVGSQKLTYQASGGYLFLSPIYGLIAQGAPGLAGTDLHMPGLRFQGEIRYYYLKLYNKKQLSKVFLPSGLYVSLNGSYATADLKARDVPVQKIDFTMMNLNFLGGVQLMYNDVLGFDLFAGIGYKSNSITYYNLSGDKTSWDPQIVGLGDYYMLPINFKFGGYLTFGLL